MTYKGRIIGLTLMTVNSLIGMCYSIFSTGNLEWPSAVIILIQLPLGWLIGKQFDKVKFLNNELQHIAFRDYLTGLPNRHMLINYFQEALERCKHQDKKLAIMYIDLDRFKFINDTMGHDAGDQLLKQVSHRLVGNVRKGDIVARQGGDEFIILLEDIEKAGVKEVAAQILHSFRTPFHLKGEDCSTSPSIGVSLYPNDGKDVNILIKNADRAMYLSKKRGKNNYQLYMNEDPEVFERELIVEQELKSALDNNEFTLHYQPKADLKTGKVYGVEALLRWNHPTLGFVSPGEFIPIAEKTGMIVSIGKWVLQEASKQNKRWQNSGMQIKTAVNVSSIQFESNHFVEDVKEVLTENQLDPDYLGIEITESVMQNTTRSSAIIHELNDMGLKVYMDDFGTGYSSLSVLNSLPIDIIKIDKSFVDEMLVDHNTALLVKTIIKMGRNLNFDLIAEGIEDKKQAEFLMKNGCRLGQGYYYSRPLPANKVEELFHSNLTPA